MLRFLFFYSIYINDKCLYAFTKIIKETNKAILITLIDLRMGEENTKQNTYSKNELWLPRKHITFDDELKFIHISEWAAKKYFQYSSCHFPYLFR